MITNATKAQLQDAMSKINAERYEYNILFSKIEPEGKSRMRFTLRVYKSSGPGHRRGQTPMRNDGRGRALINACWHVHGHFFEELFAINPNAWVKTGDKTITKDKGNWQDWNIGSIVSPMYYSEACDCME